MSAVPDSALPEDGDAPTTAVDVEKKELTDEAPHIEDEAPPADTQPEPKKEPEEQQKPTPSPKRSPSVELDPNSDDPMKMPPHGTEVYVGGITKNATDAQIQEFCEQTGSVFRLRCPKDPNVPGQNRGYAFVTYTTREAAHEAVATLNQTEMKDFPEKKVSLILSQVKNRLFVGNIPRDISREELREIFNDEVRGVVDVELLMDTEHIHNRGFCFLECYNHGAADQARRTLSRPDFKVKDRSVTVTWAEPRKVDPEQEKVRSIYVGNLPESVTETALKDIFKAYGDIEKVVLLPSRDGRSQRDYGFVHYADRSCALKAVEAADSQPLYLEERRLRVSIARPTSQRDDWGAEGSSLRRSRSRDYGDYPYRGSERDYGGGGGGGGYPPNPYGMNSMALVPTYLPNGQVGFVFQQTPMPGAGNPMPMSRATRPYGGSYRYKPY